MPNLPPQPPLPQDDHETPASAVYTPGAGIAAILGGPLSTDSYGVVTAPAITASTIENWIRAGQAFIYSAQNVSVTGVANDQGNLSVFNSSTSGKSIYVYRIDYYCTVAGAPDYLCITTSDPAYGGSPRTNNQKAVGGATSVASVSLNTETSGVPGTIIADYAHPASTVVTLNTGLVLPAGQNSGVVFCCSVGTVTTLSYSIDIYAAEF